MSKGNGFTGYRVPERRSVESHVGMMNPTRLGEVLERVRSKSRGMNWSDPVLRNTPKNRREVRAYLKRNPLTVIVLRDMGYELKEDEEAGWASMAKIYYSNGRVDR